MYCLSLRTPGGKVTLFEGTFEKCRALAEALYEFPDDYISVVVYEQESLNEVIRTESPNWS